VINLPTAIVLDILNFNVRVVRKSSGAERGAGGRGAGTERRAGVTEIGERGAAF